MKPFFSLQLLNLLNKLWVELKKRGGEWMLSPSVMICTLVVLMIPLFLLFSSLYHRYDHLVQAEKRLHLLERKAKKTMVVRSRAAAFMKQLQEADKNFIADHVQSLRLLEQEKQKLHLLRNTPVLKESISLIEREQALKENNIILQETLYDEHASFKESVCALTHPIELDAHDLKTLLNRIEYPMPKKPQLMFQSFSLKRKPLSQSYEVFECNFTLVQRILKESL